MLSRDSKNRSGARSRLRDSEVNNNTNPGGSSLDRHRPEINWDWKSHRYFPDWYEPLFELMARYIPKCSDVLEVGAASSYTLVSLAKKLRCKAWGVELDIEGLSALQQIATGEHVDIGAVRADAFHLPFRSNQFDVVYSLGLVEHFSPLASAALISEHVRVCRSGGRVIVSVPNLLNLPHTIRKFLSGKSYGFYPERSYLPRRLRRDLEKEALRVVAVDGLLPLYSFAMMNGGWRVLAILRRLGLSRRLDSVRSPRIRAALGFMTFAVGDLPFEIQGETGDLQAACKGAP